jgi:hypothetical protein
MGEPEESGLFDEETQFKHPPEEEVHPYDQLKPRTSSL